MEHIEQAGVHSGDSACSLPPYSPVAASCRTSCAAQTVAMARGARRRRAHERAVRDPGRATVYVLEVNPRASRTVPFVSKATGRAAREDRGALHGRPDARRAGRRRRGRAAVLLGEGGGVPVHQVPGRGHDPRAGDEVDGRGDGRGRDLRRGVREEPARRGRAAAAVAARRSSACATSDKPRAVEIGPHAARARLRARRHARHGGGAGGRRRPGAPR